MQQTLATTIESLEVREARTRPRFIVSQRLEALVTNQQATICNLSAGGIGITHPVPIKIGSSVLIRISALENDGDVAIRGRLAWSRLSRVADSNGKYQYNSGVSVLDDSPAVAGLMGRLIRTYGSRDTDSLHAKRHALELKAKSRGTAMTVVRATPAAPTITSDQALMIQQARQILANNPDAAKKWYDRAKYSLVNRGVIASADRAVPYRREVLVVWEYLEGKLDLDFVSAILDPKAAERA